MIALFSQSLLLAQAPPAGQDGASGLFRLLMPMIFIMVLFYFMLIRPQKKKEQELRETLNNLKENDRVVTVGGIHGVVTNVRRDADQVTIRVDEANGTKLKVNVSAIARVLTGDDQDTGGTSGNKT